MLVHFIRKAQLHRVRVLVGVFVFLVFCKLVFEEKNEPSTISWRVIIDTQKQGKANDNGPHSMVRSMWLLLELLWQNCCHHPVDTKKPRGHVIPWPLPRSPLFRTTTGQKRERERERERDQTSCAYSLIPGGPCAFPAACAQDSILRECICAWSLLSSSWLKMVASVCLFIPERDQTSCAYSPPATLAHFQQLEHRI